ncbi:N-acetylglutamate synthase, GNAT family [Saccharopolyspora shandongensis]|uniref:N-acetylglutamate synthase, GNAT family n=1 Tax=Saccharopolyspora shandongensis TaxID=418495 RepID=A0A1H3SMJ5_9PSEU|nr:N-acetylglutamate synthase, GNAT family [Saccharopolyspora shandongensis]
MPDVAALEDLARSAYSLYARRMDRPPAPVVADYSAAVREHQVWVAEEGDRVLGMLVLVPEDDVMLLENVAVHPDAQGRGLGRDLLALAEREAARQRMTEIRLYTNEVMAENLAYYPRHGYVETGRAEQDGYHRVFFRKPVVERSDTTFRGPT